MMIQSPFPWHILVLFLAVIGAVNVGQLIIDTVREFLALQSGYRKLEIRIEADHFDSIRVGRDFYIKEK